MIDTSKIIETLTPTLIKGFIVIIIIAIFQILFSKFLRKIKNKKSKKEDTPYIKELKNTINKLTNENKKLKNQLRNISKH